MTRVFIDGSEGTTGLRIHERFEGRDDISVLSFDDNLLFNYLTPRITCIAQPVQELSQVAVKLLLKKMSGEAGVSRSFLPPDIVVRDSVRVI